MNQKITTSIVASFLLATTHLQAKEYQLSPITVTSATKTEQSLKDVTSNVSVITQEEIEERHYKTVAEALNTLPGISMVNNGGIGQPTSIYLRGMDSSKTLVLIDGIRYNDPTGLSGSNFEHLMMDNIERIEVIKGAQSSVWGADASAGVINIITKSAKEGTYATTGVEYGSFDTKKINASVSHKNKNFDAKLNLSRTQTDGFTAQAPQGSNIDDFEDDGYKNTSADLKVGYNFDENNKISASYGIIDAKTDYDSMSANDTDQVTTKNNFSAINYENITALSTTNIYANRSTFERIYANPFMPKYEGEVDEYGIKSTLPYLNNSSFVTIGGDYKTFEHKNDLHKEYNSKALYVTNNNKFNNENTILTQSVRFDRYDKFDNKTTGKIGVKHYLAEELSLSSNYGTGYNVPTIYQLFEPAGAWGVVGNQNLQPEKTKGYDVQVAYGAFAVTYFDTEINNLIGWGNGYENKEGNSQIKGVELAYKKDVMEDLFLNLAYTNLNAKDAKKERLVNRPKDKIGFGVDYYGISKLHFNVNGEYIGDRTDYSTAQTGNYTLWNGVVNYEISKTLNAYVKLDNITDKNYQTVDGYATAPRSAYVGIKASF